MSSHLSLSREYRTTWYISFSVSRTISPRRSRPSYPRPTTKWSSPAPRPLGRLAQQLSLLRAAPSCMKKDPRDPSMGTRNGKPVRPHGFSRNMRFFWVKELLLPPFLCNDTVTTQIFRLKTEVFSMSKPRLLPVQPAEMQEDCACLYGNTYKQGSIFHTPLKMISHHFFLQPRLKRS